jgi:hypothetical protein
MAWEPYLDMNNHPLIHSYLALVTVRRNVSLSNKRPTAVCFYKVVVMSSTTPSENNIYVYVGPDNWPVELPTSLRIAVSCDLATMNHCILSLGGAAASEFVPTFRNTLFRLNG